MILRGFILLALAVSCFGYSPQPKVVTPAETELKAALEAAETDDAKVAVAEDFLGKHPDNIPLARQAQNIINRNSDIEPAWFKERMEADPRASNHYLWARASHDSKVMHEQATWIMENDPDNFWGYYLAGVAYWDQEEPDMNKVIEYFEQAIAKEPSRFEGYYWVGYAYEETEKLENALAAFEAARVVDPESDGPPNAMMGIYAQLRNADKYFELIEGKLPTAPLTVELEIANPKSAKRLTPADLTGGFTVLEVFTYW